MIILIIAFFLVMSYICLFYIKPALPRYILGVIALLALATSLLFLLGNFAWNWGTKTVTTTETKTIYTAGEKNANYGILVHQEVGTSSGNYVFVYRTSKGQKNPGEHFVPDQKNIIQAVKKTAVYETTSADKATVKTVTVRREFSLQLAKNIFDIGSNNHTLVSQKSTVYVPKDTWMILTAAQAKELEAKAPEMEKAAQAEAAAAKAKMTAELEAQAAAAQQQTEAAMAADPAAAQQIQAAAEAKIAAAEASAKAQAAKEMAAAQTPQAEIAMIKKFMGWK